MNPFATVSAAFPRAFARIARALGHAPGIAFAAGLSALSLTFAAAGTATALAAVPEAPASPVIERFHATLIDVMKNAGTMRFEGRYERLAPAVKESFNLSFMARFAAGSYWKKLGAAERDKLVAAFTQMTIATYADRFDGYSGQRFETVGEQPLRRDTRLVKTGLIKRDGETVKLNYLLRPSQGRWRIVDIHLKGVVSELAVRRSEYTSVLKRVGFNGLIRAIEKKIDNLKAKQG